MQKAGKYEIVRKVGAGGFGVVYEGRDPFIKRRVAIKTCTTEDEEIRQRFYREAEIAGNLQHKNIVTIHDFGIQDGVPYLVQEYLTGEDLEHLIGRGDAVPLRRKVEILLEVARGMNAAHQAGVIHRDIKPANIRLLDDGQVKILDFGIAKLAHVESRLTKEGMTVGTAAYLPPEQIRGERIDFRADIFSFGVLSYELVAMARPFDARTLSTLLYQILSLDPKPLGEVRPDIPARLAALVGHCLDKDVEKRCASFAIVATELEGILARLVDEGPAPGVAGASDATARLEIDSGAVERQRVEARQRQEAEAAERKQRELAERKRQEEEAAEKQRREAETAERQRREAEAAAQAQRERQAAERERQAADERERQAAERERRRADLAGEIDAWIERGAFAKAERGIERAEGELGPVFAEQRRQLAAGQSAKAEAERAEAERQRAERDARNLREQQAREAAERQKAEAKAEAAAKAAEAKAEAAAKAAEAKAEAEARAVKAKAAAAERAEQERVESAKRAEQERALAERKAEEARVEKARKAEAARVERERREAEEAAETERRAAAAQEAAAAARERAIAKSVERVEKRLGDGDLGRARRELDKARGELGEIEPLVALAGRLAEREAEAEKIARERSDRDRAQRIEALAGDQIPTGSFASPGSSMPRASKRTLLAAASVAALALTGWLIWGRGPAAQPVEDAPGKDPLASASQPPETTVPTPSTTADAPPEANVVVPETVDVAPAQQQRPAPAVEERRPEPSTASPERPSPEKPRSAEVVTPQKPPVETRPVPPRTVPAPVETRPVETPAPAPASTAPAPPPETAPAETKPPAEVAPAADPTPGARAAIERYRAAYQALDAGAVRAAWPGLDANAARQIGRAFEGYHSVTMSIDGCRFDLSADRGTATCRMKQVIDLKVGSDINSTQQVTFGLRRDGERWVITERSAR